MSSPSTALAKIEGLPSAPIAKIEDLARTFEALGSRVNLISPVASVDHIMPMHQVSLRAVTIDPTVDGYGSGPECYRDPRFCKANEVALGKNALTKLMAAAGVQIVQRTRLDDRTDPNYCEVEVMLAVRDFDGTFRQIIATKEMDMRAGAPETMKPEKDAKGNKTGKLVAYEDTALADKRRHIQSHAETKAIERGLRVLFSLRQKYTLDELKKPFVVPKLVAALDPDDPETKTALIQHALHGEAALFGPRGGNGSPARALAPAPVSERRQLASAPAGVDPETGEDTEEDLSAFDDEDLDPPTEKTTGPTTILQVCECPCGHQAEIPEGIAKMTKERRGGARCGACWPGAEYDVAAHKDLRDLGLIAYPGADQGEKLTPAQAAELKAKAVEAAKKKAAAR